MAAQDSLEKQESGTRISINAKLLSWIERILEDDQSSDDLRSRLQQIKDDPADPKTIPVTTVQKVAEYASIPRDSGKTPKTKAGYLDDFMTGVKWYFAEGGAPEKRDYDAESPVERIRNDAAARRYAEMVRNVDPAKKGSTQSFAADLKAADKESVAVFNCLLTVIGAFVFGYFATGYAIGSNVVAQVLVALSLAVVVGVADVYFLLKKLYTEEKKLEESTVSQKPTSKGKIPQKPASAKKTD